MRAIDARLEQPWSDLVSSAGLRPEIVPPHERQAELASPNDLDLLRDDEAAEPPHAGGLGSTGPADGDDLTLAI